MSAYIIPEGWTPIELQYEGRKLVNILLSNGEIMAGDELWSYLDHISREPLLGLPNTKAYAVAWQLIEPLQQRPRPALHGWKDSGMKANLTDREVIESVLVDLRAVRALLIKPEPAIYSFNEDTARRMLTTIVNKLTNHTQPLGIEVLP